MKKFIPQKNKKANDRQLAADWEALLARHSKPLEKGTCGKFVKSIARPVVTPTVKEVKTTFESMRGVGALPTPKIYTGDRIVGIATMHKSNLVPIFNEQAAIEVAQMRRG